MGIKGLTQLIKINSPNAIQTKNLHNLTGKKVAIDATLFMYKMLINMRNSDQSYLTSKDGRLYRWLERFNRKLEKLYEKAQRITREL